MIYDIYTPIHKKYHNVGHQVFTTLADCQAFIAKHYGDDYEVLRLPVFHPSDVKQLLEIEN